MALIGEARLRRDRCDRCTLPQQASCEVKLGQEPERVGGYTVQSSEAPRVAFSAHVRLLSRRANRSHRQSMASAICRRYSQATMRCNQARYGRRIKTLTATPSTVQICDETSHVIAARGQIEIQAENVVRLGE